MKVKSQSLEEVGKRLHPQRASGDVGVGGEKSKEEINKLIDEKNRHVFLSDKYTPKIVSELRWQFSLAGDGSILLICF